MSKIKYTLTLHTDGKEVWQHWTGDRDEALRDLAHTLPDLDVDENRAVNFMLAARDIDPTALLPGQEHGAIVLTKDLGTRLTFEVKRKKE